VVAGVGLVRAFRGPRIEAGKTRVLLIGDSFADGIGPPLQALAADGNVPFSRLSRSGTRIDQWAASQKLAERLASFQPTLVLVSLGTNDEYMTGSDVPARQAPYLEQLLLRLQGAGAEVVWIGPPRLPRATNGVVPLIKRTVPKSHYFASDRLSIPRGPDGLHPTLKGYVGWAGAVWKWLS